MPIVKNAIISCAGRGTRLGLNKTKCLVNIRGKSIIQRQLEILKDFDAVFIIVGFQFMDVIQYVESLGYENVIFVLNHDYATTNCLYSINKVISKIDGENIFILDGDVLINEKDFKGFVEEVEKSPSTNIITYSKSATENAIFISIENDEIVNFSYDIKTEYEWCGIAYIANSNLLRSNDRTNYYIFQKLMEILPAKCHQVQSFEIDTPADLIIAEKNFIEPVL